MGYKYTYQSYDEKTMAKVAGTNLPVSKKDSNEVLRFIKGRNLDKAVAYLQEVIKLKKPVPFTRYVSDLPHRHGMGPGKYPKNASIQIVSLLNSLKKNAEAKGLKSNSLVIVHGVAQNGPIIPHYGRKIGHRKNIHIEIVAQEIELKEKGKKAKAAPAQKPAQAKQEVKQVKKEAPKEVNEKELISNIKTEMGKVQTKKTEVKK